MITSDIETSGLLHLGEAMRFHCAWVGRKGDKTSQEGFRPHQFNEYCNYLEKVAGNGELIVFHNGIAFDYPALQMMSLVHRGKHLNVPEDSIIDTIVLSRLIYSNLKDLDLPKVRRGQIDGSCYGNHRLEAWGQRLGVLKGSYSEDFKNRVEASGDKYVDGMEWENFSEEMYDYNKQDIVVGEALLEKLLTNTEYFTNEPQGITEKERFWSSCSHSIILEHEAQWALQEMCRNGFPVDRKAIEDLYVVLAGERSKILQEVVEFFGSWYKPVNKQGLSFFNHPVTGKPLPKYPKVKYPKTGKVGEWKERGRAPNKERYYVPSKQLYVEGAPFTPVEYITFNPASRDHIQMKLKEIGWEPTEFTDSGAPKVDDETLSGVHFDDPHAEATVRLIQKYLMIQKRIGQVAEGKNAWLRLMTARDMIHHSINPNGAATGRASHSFPNIAQVPSNTSPYGLECRGAFGAGYYKDPNGNKWLQVGCDASGLELRCLAHFMAKFDGGEYADTILNGDIHWKNCVAAGLYADVKRDKHNPEHEAARGNAKTFIYGFLYGAGAAKLGEIVRGGKDEGKRLLDKFQQAVPAIAQLRNGLKETLIASEKWTQAGLQTKWKRKWVKGIDGRRIWVRSAHSALNFLLQGAGAVLCKEWVVETKKEMLRRGYKCGWDGDYVLMAWVHDEQQFAARNQEVADALVEVCQFAMRNVGEYYKWRMALDTEGKIGYTWADCH